MRANVTLEGVTPNRKFEFQVEAIATDDEGVMLDAPVEWLVRHPKTGVAVFRPVKYKALAQRLEEQADEQAQDGDFTLAIHEGMADRAEYAYESSQDR